MPVQTPDPDEPELTPQQKWNADFIERKKKTMPPNPHQEKGRKLYEWWRSGCGAHDPALTEMTQDIRPFDRLNPYERARWVVMAKALGDRFPHHERVRGSRLTVPEQEQRYAAIPAGTGWAEYDSALNPAEKWNGQSWSTRKVRVYWWQLWRPLPQKVGYSPSHGNHLAPAARRDH
jgi:hypothetical protein